MLKIEGIMTGKETREKDGKKSFHALIVDGMDAFKVSSTNEIKGESGQKVSIPVRASEYKGNIYYSQI